MPPFDLDCADRDWRRDYTPAELEARQRRAAEADLREPARTGSARRVPRSAERDASEQT